MILSRHFMIRVTALMKFIKNDDEAFDWKVKDFWYRIEFQNCGSFHLHMVVWLENHPAFELEFFYLMVTARIPTEEEDPELSNLGRNVKFINKH